MPKAKSKSVASKSKRVHTYQTSKDVTDAKGKVTKEVTKHEILCADWSDDRLEDWIGGACTQVGYFKKFVTLAHQHEISKARIIAGLKEVMGDVQKAMKYIDTKHGVVKVQTDSKGKGKKARKKVDYS